MCVSKKLFSFSRSEMSSVVINLTTAWKSSRNSDYVNKNEERVKLTYMQKARKQERKRKRKMEKKIKERKKEQTSLFWHYTH